MAAVTFGPFRLNLQSGELERAGVCIKLQPQPAKLLVLLVQRAGELVTRDEIRRAVWGAETFVDFDQSVNFCVRQVRTALRDNADAPCYIETLPRRGYRFIAPVRLESADEHPAVTPTAPTLPAAPAPSRPLAAAAFAVAIVAAAVGSSLFWQSPRAASRAPGAKAAEQVQLGRFFLNKVSRADALRALELFESAARHDPQYAPAFAGIADAYEQLGTNFVAGHAPSDARLRAMRAAKRAIQLDPTLAEPHAALGSAALRELDWPEAERSLRRAIELNPRYAPARQTYASYLAARRRFPEAIDQARTAVRLDPVSLAARQSLAWMLYFARRYDEAARELRTVLEMDRTYAAARRRLGQVLLMAGRDEEAMAILLQAVDDTQRAPAILGLLALAYGRRGRPDEAVRISRELEARLAAETMPTGPLVLAHLGAGDESRAIDWLERVYADRDGLAIYMDVDPLMDPLRDQPRYQALCRQLLAGAER